MISTVGRPITRVAAKIRQNWPRVSFQVRKIAIFPLSAVAGT